MCYMPRSILEAAAADETPALRVSTKYMQTFQLVKPALGGTGLATHVNSTGDLDLYSVGTNDQVYRLRRGEQSEAPYEEAALGITARQLFVYSEAATDPDTPSILGINPAGELTLSTWNGEMGGYVQRVSQPSLATEKLRRFLGVRGTTGGIYANVVLDTGVLANNFMKTGTTDWAGKEWVAVKGPDGAELKPKTIAMCVNDPVQSALFAIGQNDEVLFAEDSFRDTRMRVLTSSATLNAAIELSVVADSDGKLNIFAIEAGSGALWWKKERKFSTGGRIQFEDWVKLDSETPLALTRVFACQRFDGLLQVFGIGKDGRLYRATQVAGSRGKAEWRALFPLGNSIDNSVFTVGRTGQGYAEAYTVSPDGKIRRFWQSPSTEQWFEEVVELPQSDETMAEVPTHATEVTVLDPSGMPKPDAPISMSASNLITLFVDGKSYRCSQVDTVSVNSGADGKVVIHQKANALAAASLYMATPGTLAAAPIAVQPNAQLQGRLATLTSEEILNAKDASGEYLLKEEYRKEQYADSLQKITKASMDIAAEQEGGDKVSYKFFSRRAAAFGFNPRTNFAALDGTAWEIDFSSGFPVYSDTTVTAVAAWRSQKLALMGSDELGGFLGIEWGSVWNGIKEGATWLFDEMKKIVITIVDGVASVLFEIGGKVFEAIIEFAQQAFDFVEGVWNWIKVKLEQLYEWLAFLFNFKDFVRSAEAVRHTIGVVLDFSAEGVRHVKDVLVAGIDSMKGDLKETVDRYVADLNGKNNPTLGAFSTENEPSDDDTYASEHNVFLNAYRDNYQSATSSSAGLALANPQIGAALEEVIDQLAKMADNFQFGDGKEAFEEALGYFTSIGENPDRVLELLMSGVIKTLEATALFALDFGRGVIITLLDLIADLIELFRDAIFSEWEIPVLSQLYKLFTGSSLGIQIVNILAYLIAVPGTLIYKVITGEAPFPNQQSVDEYKAFFTVGWLKSKMGMTLTAEEQQQIVPAISQRTITIICLSFYSAAMACRLFTDAVTALNSAKATNDPPPPETLRGAGGDRAAAMALPKPPIMAAISIGLRYISTAMTCPYLLNTSLGAPECGAGKPGFAAYTWIAQVVFGPTRGMAVAVLMKKSGGKTRAYAGEITLSVWGAAHIIMGVWHYCWTESEKQNPLALARGLTNWVPGQFIRFLNTPDMNQKGKFIPVGIFIVVQSISYLGSIGCAIAEAVKAKDTSF